ncbi:MAG: hypothetical protein DMF75_09520 [Acidobacteria bacterium]|nr:MAG: hypothetical protein DMF75_09520 [Acidobacteriota bacterium]
MIPLAGSPLVELTSESMEAPIRRENLRAGEPARYSGWTDGNKMTLTVVLSDTKETVGTFTLVRGQEARVSKCR